MKKLFMGLGAATLLIPSQRAAAQIIGLGGDQITSTVSHAGSYLQKLALGIFVIMLTVGAIRMGFDPQHRSGIGIIVGCVIGIAITVLAPVFVQVVQNWTGGFLFGF